MPDMHVPNLCPAVTDWPSGVQCGLNDEHDGAHRAWARGVTIHWPNTPPARIGIAAPSGQGIDSHETVATGSTPNGATSSSDKESNTQCR